MISKTAPFLLTALLLACPLPGQQPRTDTIDPNVEHQIIENFGASDCWSMQKLGLWSQASRERVADLLFSQTKGAGLSCWRFNIGGGINPQISSSWRTAETFEVAEGKYDWTHQAGERWFLGAAKARGVPQFLAFVNSPPGRMTRNGITFTTKGLGSTNLKPGFEGQFAQYLVDILDHFRNNPDPSERIVFDYVSPVNEPQGEWNTTKQEGTRNSNADIKKIAVELAARLKTRKLSTQIALIESSRMANMYSLNEEMTKEYGVNYGNYIDEFLGDPAISPLLSGRFLYHDYSSDVVGKTLLEWRQQLRKKQDQYPGWKFWMSEWCCTAPVGADGAPRRGRDLTMNTALAVARVMHLDLTINNVSAWQWWLGATNVNTNDGLVYTDFQKPGDPETVYSSRLLWMIGNYSRFIRPGMRRIELSGVEDDIQGLMRSAYKDEAGRKIVAVYVNMANEPQRVGLNFVLGKRSWKLQSLTPYITSDREGDELKAYPPLPAGQAFEIPARSVMTIVAQFAAR